MSELLLLLMVFPLLAFVFVLISPKEQLNGYYVVIFAIFSSILLIIRIFSQLNFNEVEILYKASNEYNKSADRGIMWCDKDINIDWGIDFEPVLSEKDKIQPKFSQINLEEI